MYLSRFLTAARARFFSFEGRIGRMTFLRRYVLLYAVVFIPAVGAVFASLDTAMHGTSALIVSAAAGLLVLAGGVPLVVQRFHDFNASGELAAVYYIVGVIIGVARAEALQAEMARVSDVLGQSVGVGAMGSWLLLWCLPGIAWMMVPLLMPGQTAANRYGAAAEPAANDAAHAGHAHDPRATPAHWHPSRQTAR